MPYTARADSAVAPANTDSFQVLWSGLAMYVGPPPGLRGIVCQAKHTPHWRPA